MYMIWFSWILCHANHCRLFNTKSTLHINIKYMYIYIICKHISYKTFLNKPELFFHTVKWPQALLYNSHNLRSVIYLHAQLVLWDP